MKHVDGYTKSMIIDLYNKPMMLVDLANQLRNNHRRGGWREQVATRLLASACQMKYERNVNRLKI